MKATTELPDDPALPGLRAIRAIGVAGALPALELDERPVEVALRGYTPGSRATFEARAGDRHFAVKLYAEDAESEAELYEALAAAGLVGVGPVRVPPLLARDSTLQLLVIGWLDGPTAYGLIKSRRGARAGELAARWLRCSASLPVKLGPPLGAADMVCNAGKEVVQLDAADHGLGAAARQLARMLTRTLPKNGPRRLVHGTFYARHVLDQGDGVGVIDWQRFGQGPLELDAGMFLATIWRYGFDHEPLAGEVARAEEALLAGTADLIDERVLAWHRAAALLRLAGKVYVVERRKENWRGRADALLAEATRLAEFAARPDPVARVQAPALRLNGAALELILGALSTRPATPEELEQIRKLLSEGHDRAP